MTAHADSIPAVRIPTPGSSQPADELLEGFASFVAASQQLEASYYALRDRAAAVDVELAESNGKLRETLAERDAVLGALPLGVFALSAAGDVEFANPEAERLMAASADADPNFDLLRCAVGDFESGALVVRVRRVPLPQDRSLVVVEDRSRMVALEHEVDRLDRLAGLSELALGVAHEIKNPLNGVMGFAALMERTDDSATIQRYRDRVVGGLHQVDHIVREMLAFARPTNDRAVERRSVREVVRSAAAEAGVHGDTLDVRVPDDAWVDAAVLGRVLVNLFRNSREATRGERLRLLVEGGCTGGNLTLRVVDNGPGIAEADAERLFQPFVSTKNGGHGLGLALAARVLGFLGGSLALTNAGQAGADFRITVPLASDPD